MKDRIISSIIMAIIFVIFYLLGGNYFIFLTSFLSLFMYKEVISLKSYPKLVTIIGLISILLIIIYNSIGYGFFMGIRHYTLILPLILLILPSLLPKYQKKYLISDAFTLFAFITFIGLSISSINSFMILNKNIILYLLSITICNDVFAFLIGSKFGKIKYSKISPNKTLEGNIAGILFGSIAGVLVFALLISKIDISYTIIITIVLNVACQVGDLMFSKIKREHNIKDFSNLIKGHGGMLDRMDSILFTSLVYMLIMTII